MSALLQFNTRSIPQCLVTGRLVPGGLLWGVADGLDVLQVDVTLTIMPVTYCRAPYMCSPGAYLIPLFAVLVLSRLTGGRKGWEIAAWSILLNHDEKFSP